MLKVKNFFDRPDIDKVDAVLIRNVKYLRTFTVDDFKALYNIDKVRVIMTETHFLAFTYLNCMGYVAERTVPNNPRISLMTDTKGNLFFLLHEDGYNSQDLMFYKSLFINRKSQSISQSRHFGVSSDWREEQEYIRSSFEDAFENDSDAYWNID